MTPVAELEVVTARALAWPEHVRGLAVTDAASYEAGAELLKGIKALRAELDATFDPIVSSAFRAHRTACEQKRKAEAPLSQAEATVKAALIRYDDEQERLRRAAQRRAEEEARRRDEDERLARAAELEREGNEFGDPALVEEAEALISQPPAPVAIAPVEKATPKVSGQHFVTTWSAQVTDMAAFVKFIASRPQFLNLLTVNQAALNAQARSLKEALQIPGVRAVPTKTLASRS
jgi:hypothetical protein